MKKKMYEKPSVEVVKLQASVAMLAGSGTEQVVAQKAKRMATAPSKPNKIGNSQKSSIF